jgi:hypothetical protein
MKPPEFFQNLGHRFRDLQSFLDPNERFHAIVVETTRERHAANLRRQERATQLLAESATRLLADAGEDRKDEATRRQQEAMALANQCRQEALAFAASGGADSWREYVFSGGSADEAASQSLMQRWSDLASIGAMAADLVVPNQDALDVWLELLRERSPYFRVLPGSETVDGERFETRDGRIDRLCSASIELCLGLEQEATCASMRAQAERSTTGPETASPTEVEILETPDLDQDVGTPVDAADSDLAGQDIRAQVDAYIKAVRTQTSDRHFSKTTIWKEDAEYEDPTMFYRWQRGDPRTSHQAKQTFDRILREKPRLKRNRTSS